MIWLKKLILTSGEKISELSANCSATLSEALSARSIAIASSWRKIPGSFAAEISNCLSTVVLSRSVPFSNTSSKRGALTFPIPSKVQSAWNRPNSDFPFFTRSSRGPTELGSFFSTKSRCAISRNQPS